jgi:hypothetical protein
VCGSAAALLALTLPLVGCGDGSQTLTASEFVDRINAEGVTIELGGRLATSGEASELYAVELPPLPGEPKPAPGSEGEPGAGGSLYLFEDGGGAEDQLRACQGSGGLLCFRAENIVVILDEESSRLTAQRFAVAMQRLRSE